MSKLVPDKSETSPLLDKLVDYRKFAAQYASDFESAARPISTKELKFPTGHVLRFRGLTSVQVSDLRDRHYFGKMVLGNRQYIFDLEDNVEYVIMSHHPLTWFKDKVHAKQYLAKRARVHLFGHEHLAAIEKSETEGGSEYLVIDAGATNPPGVEDRQSYTYNWIEFELQQKGESFEMDVTVHPRVWMENKTEFGPDTNRLDGKTSRMFSIRCSQYRPIATPIPPTTENTPSLPISVHQNEPDAMPNDDRFPKLLYYFWRYLDWRDRLAVLVNADVLPSSLDQPIPQVMERNALAMARDQKKLGKIWDEVMAKVPIEEREPNPYV